MASADASNLRDESQRGAEAEDRSGKSRSASGNGTAAWIGPAQVKQKRSGASSGEPNGPEAGFGSEPKRQAGNFDPSRRRSKGRNRGGERNAVARHRLRVRQLTEALWSVNPTRHKSCGGEQESESATDVPAMFRPRMTAGERAEPEGRLEPTLFFGSNLALRRHALLA